MRFRLPLLLVVLAASASAADLTIVRTFTGWRDAASFKHISEYFDGKENTHGQVILRTDPARRGGYYFLVRLANAGAPLAVTIKLDVVRPTDATAKTFSFAADLKAGATVLNLGLTGADWPDARANPVAWKLTVLSADGRELATDKSYLWEKPGDN